MLRRLRIKFILTNMLLVTLVLLAVFGTLVCSTASQLERESVAVMKMMLRGDGTPPQFEFKAPLAGVEREWQSMIPAFSVTVDEAGEISLTAGESVKVSQEVVEQAAEQVLAGGADSGKLDELGLRFLVKTTQTGETQIAFCDRSWEQASLWRLVINSLLIGAGALVVFFLISLFLSHLALKPVEEAWRQQRQFVADASHELKTPLTVILANTGIVEGHSGDTVASQAKWISYIREEAQRMKGLVEDMLFLARHDDARQPAKFQPCSLSDLVTGCVLRFESVAFEAGVELESDIQPGLTLQGDADCLERLVMILLDNGVKYAGEPGRVELTLRRRQERAVLAVTNTGPPIPPEHLEHLFQRFYRVDRSRSRKEGGYGLGLAIAQTIVQDHRGQIEVTSDERKGTCFTVTLPRVRIPSKK